ncbi:MAG: CapA family protein [Spirochaetes bacterium]|nr:CapA family protein [Spirochaetota bacterium]
MSRLLFKRYLVPFSLPALVIPPALVILGIVVALLVTPTSRASDSVAAAADPPAAADNADAPGTPSAGGQAGAARTPGADRAPEDASELLLTFLGDIMAHTVNFSMADYARIYEDVRDELRSDDLTFANLETPVLASRPYETYPRFNVRPEYARAAADAGVDVLSVANNHVTDWGADGVAETRSAMGLLAASHGLASNGTRRNAGAELEVTELHAGGRRIGFVAVTQALNVPDGRELVQIVDYRDPVAADVFAQWVSVRASGFDLFIVSYHGGREYALEPDPAKAVFFERLARAGADVVWSHHPHVVQPWRYIERADGNSALILHSTGNFISGQAWRLGPEHAETARAHTGDSPLFQVRARWQHSDGAHERLLLQHEPLLAANYRDPVHGMVVRRLDELIRSDIDPRWKRYYVVRRNALQEVAWRSERVRIASGLD